MNFSIFRRAGLISIIGATLLSSAACVKVNEQIGQNLIPTDQLWDVFSPKAVNFVENDIELKTSDSLSAYTSRRIVFGATKDNELGTCTKATSFTLVPAIKDLDLGENTVVRQFHFSAVRDTLSTVNDNQQRMMQNVYVYGLKETLDSTILYTNSLSPGIKPVGASETNRERFIDLSKLITKGVPVYNGGDSLSFDFSAEYSARVVEGIKTFHKNYVEKKDTLLSSYLKLVPGIYIESEVPASEGGRINMFDFALQFDSNNYISGNYAELKITADYDDRKGVDTSFIFLFGPADFIATEGASELPTQYAFNGSTHESDGAYLDGEIAVENIYVEGGSGVKPVIKASGIKRIVEELVAEAGIVNPEEVVINKATINLPYNVEGDWDKLNKFPQVLSPTVKLHGTDDSGVVYVSYAGLTDASIESENQGDINRSTSVYSPDMSHHVQEILRLKKEDGESDADYEARLAKYDIWMLIIYEEITESSSSSSAYDDYYNSLMYNSYYNNMMYDPYGYGYGYGGYGGYGYGGYGGYGYGYGNNYYNYLMMASYMNSGSTSTSSTSSSELDKDRYYRCTLAGPKSTLTDSITGEPLRPTLKITFSAPKTAEKAE